MRQSLVPVLLLAIVALSSSNILPILSTNLQESQKLGIDGQQNDNTFSNKFNIRDILRNIFYKVPSDANEYIPLPKKMSKYVNTNNNRAERNFDGIIVKEDNYDDEGFRKEQWHNYPRQLDRLHRYIFEHNTDVKRTGDFDDLDNILEDNINNKHADINLNDDTTNLDNNDGTHNTYDVIAAATNPLLVFKIHLACLSNRVDNKKFINDYDLETDQTKLNNDIEDKGEEERIYTDEENPAIKVKREGASFQESMQSDDNSMDGTKKPVSKRIFSLWSRLQSLSHKGHELPMHRRHFHAFYNLPDSDGGGVLTAETRATFMRPPGSPLRWG